MHCGRTSEGLPQDIPPRGLCSRSGWSGRIRLWLILWLYLCVLFELLRAAAVLELLPARTPLRGAFYQLALSPIPLQLLPATLCERKLLRRISTCTMIRVRRIVGRRQRKHGAASLHEPRLDLVISC